MSNVGIVELFLVLGVLGVLALGIVGIVLLVLFVVRRTDGPRGGA